MTIENCIERSQIQFGINDIKNASCLNIGYLNLSHQRDETQLTVENDVLTEKGVEELSELFASLIEELGAAGVDSVLDITIIASADTAADLEKMGY